jgi:predicted HicB family RNase H-like nuclease
MATVYVRDFPEDIHRAARFQALEENISLRLLVIKAVEQYLARAKKKEGKG